ncbi:MAG: hypothetical protein K9J74_03720 [Sulfuritalea sp.]|nr:hypothetical protein [Sulfuritalea sp.]
MEHIDFNTLIKEANELRAKEMQRIMSGASTRLHAFGKTKTTALWTRLSHLAHQLLSWNPRAHPFH